MKKGISALLIVLLIISALPFTMVYAENHGEEAV